MSEPSSPELPTNAQDNGPRLVERGNGTEDNMCEESVQGEVEEGAEPAPAWTLDRRWRHYDVRARNSLRLLAAVGGLAVIGAGDLAGQNLGVGPCSRGWCAVPWPATVISFLLATGLFLGGSWSSFSHAARELEVRIGGDDNKGKEEWLPGSKGDPKGAETVYRVGTILFMLTGVALLVGFWSTAPK